MSNVSIRQIAEKCGVAVSTVSRAMNNRSEVSPETRERVLAAARELNYIPNANARGLKMSGLQTIAVIIQGRTSELLVEILGDLQSDLAKKGLDVFLQHIPDSEVSLQALQQVIVERRPAGILFLGRFGATAGDTGDTINRAIEDFTIPVVYCTATPVAGTASQHSSISVDDMGGAAALTRLLIQRGHRDIAFATADIGPALGGQDAWALRYRGYTSALEDAGIAVDSRLVVPSTDDVDNYSVSTGYASVSRWLATAPRFTAIVTSCDAVGLGTLRALHDAGLAVPRDIELTAFDGLELSQFTTPSMTTIVQPSREIAYATADIVFDAVTDPLHEPRHVVLEGAMRLGESTHGTTPDSPG